MGYSTNGGTGTTAETLFVSGNQGRNGRRPVLVPFPIN
jgi:hypothetical protein